MHRDNPGSDGVFHIPFASTVLEFLSKTIERSMVHMENTEQPKVVRAPFSSLPVSTVFFDRLLGKHASPS
jgi:hypothetical protein